MAPLIKPLLIAENQASRGTVRFRLALEAVPWLVFGSFMACFRYRD